MRKFFAFILILALFIPGTVEAATKVYGCTALTGGGTGALDALDGTALLDKDMAICVVAGTSYTYYLDVDSGASEVSPGVIAPNANAGLKRWILSKELARSAVRYVEEYGAKDDSGTTDNTVAIQAALTAGGIVMLTAPNGGYYKITDALTASVANTKIISNSKAEIRQATLAKGGIIVTASNVEISGIKLTGPQYAVNRAESAINAHGADKDHYITGLKVKNCHINSWGDDGITGEFVSDFEITGNLIENCYYSGILVSSWKQGIITGNNIYNIVGTPLAYGISLTRTTSDSITTKPRSSDIVVSKNVIRSVTNWNGLDTHGGQRITFEGNVVLGCYRPISVGAAAALTGTVYTWAPLDVTVAGNIIDSLVTDGSMTEGISFTGAMDGVTVNEYATGSVTNNTVRGHGIQGGATGRAAIFQATKGVTHSGNTYYESAAQGVQWVTENLGFKEVNNTYVDVWNETNATADAISITGINNTGFIGGNILRAGTKSATYLNRWMIQITNTTGITVEVGKNHLQAGINTSGGYIYDLGQKAMRGQGLTDTTITSNGDLKNQLYPLGTVARGNKIMVHARGATTGAAGDRAVKLVVNSTDIATIIPGATAAGEWSADILIWVDAYNEQRFSIEAKSGTSIVYNGFTHAHIDTSAVDFNIKFTGECAGGDSITQYMIDPRLE